MIARIKGQVVSIDTGSVLVDTGGIGYRIRVPEPVLSSVAIDEEIILYTELIIRQDLMQLYGFLTPGETDMFRLLISVSHIGPQTGLAIISRLSLPDICDAISMKKPEVLSQVPGLGKKGAERIILELQKKVADISAQYPVAGSSSSVQDTLLALISLGYNREEAMAAIERTESVKGKVSSSELVKEALVFLRKK